MPQPKELSQADIAEIVALRGVEPAPVVRKRFGIGTSRLYRIWKNAEATGQALVANGQAAEAPAADGKGQAANGSATPGQTALAPAGADVVVLLQTLGRVEEQMGRLEKQQALLLEAQEGHYEDLEELEGTVDQDIEEGANILDTLEEGSQKARTTAENVFAVAIAVRDISLAVLGLGGLSLLLWTFYPAATRVYENMTKAKASSPAPAPPSSNAVAGHA